MLILLYSLAFTAYVLAILLARRELAASQVKPAGPSGNGRSPNAAALGVLGVAVLCHATSIGINLLGSHAAPQFGFALALSIMFCGGAALLWAESFHYHIEPLWLMVLPFAATFSLLPFFFPGASLGAASRLPLFIPHLVVGMLAYSFLAFAAVHATLMILAERSLHRPTQTSAFGAGGAMIAHAGGPMAWLERLPPLLVLEKIHFRILLTGFILLTLTIGSGILFSEEVFGQPWRLDHKTVFAVIAWSVFATLLLGRFFWGWRGKLAARINLGGFCLLMMAYVGSRFVVEVLLGRA